MIQGTRPVVVFSRCLGFTACRYDGTMADASAVGFVKSLVEARSVCPETGIGLGVPRVPIRLVRSAGGHRLVEPSTGRDLTYTMQAFASSYLDRVGEVDGFVLKAKSPSCGVRDAKVYPNMESLEYSLRSSGLFAARVLERFPHLPVTTEARLSRPRDRNHFLTRLFTLARFRPIRASGEGKELVRFHSENKLLLLAHCEADERAMDRLAATAHDRPTAEMLAEYGERLSHALARPPRRGGHANVLQHALGCVSERLSREERERFLASLNLYREGKGDLTPCLGAMRDWIACFEEPYLAAQTYFEPFPHAGEESGLPLSS